MCAADLANPQEDMVTEVVLPPSRKLEDLIRLAELCVDLLRQNEEFYAEVGLSAARPHCHAVVDRAYTTGLYSN